MTRLAGLINLLATVSAACAGEAVVVNDPFEATAPANKQAAVVTNALLAPPSTNTASTAEGTLSITPEDFRTTWQIPPPDDTRYDWVQLKSGEWLKGDIKSLQKDKLSFDSDELDDLEFDWKDVHKLISPNLNTVVIDDGRKRQTQVGSLWITQDKVIVDGEETVTYPRDQLFGIVSGQPTEWNYWSGKVSLGLTLRGGNTEQVDYNARANFTRRTPSTRLALDYLGNFSETDSTETANNHRGSGSFDVFLSRYLFLRVPFGEYFRDPFQNIAHRATLGFGMGYDLFNRFNSPVVEWTVTAGPAYQHVWYESVEPGEPGSQGTAALVLGTLYNWDVTKRIEFTFKYQAQLSFSEASSSIHHTEFIWELELTKRLNFDVSLIWDYTADPRPDATGAVPKNSDYRLVLGLGLDF